MNADKHQPIQTLTEGVVLDLTALPTKNLNIIQATSSSTIGSVAFNLTGGQTTTVVQSGAPYSLFGDSGGKYLAWTPATGSYALTANSYAGANASGTAGRPLTVNVQVINQTSPSPANDTTDTTGLSDSTPTADGSSNPTATIAINNGATSTSSATVTLDIKAVGATQMRFYDDDDNVTWGAWQTVFTTKAWTLS